MIDHLPHLAARLRGTQNYHIERGEYALVLNRVSTALIKSQPIGFRDHLVEELGKERFEASGGDVSHNYDVAQRCGVAVSTLCVCCVRACVCVLCARLCERALVCARACVCCVSAYCFAS